MQVYVQRHYLIYFLHFVIREKYYFESYISFFENIYWNSISWISNRRNGRSACYRGCENFVDFDDFSVRFKRTRIAMDYPSFFKYNFNNIDNDIASLKELYWICFLIIIIILNNYILSLSIAIEIR